jgi:urease accessory protein
MTTPLELLVWLSPSFPVGAFAYSHGLEWAREAGDVRDAASLEAWLADLLAHGAARNDAILLTAAFRAALSGDDGALHDAAELALALSTSAERRLETTTQGNAFLLAIARTFPCEPAQRLRAKIFCGEVAYPVALGTAAAGHAIPLPDLLRAYALAFVQNLVSAAIRLGIVGQTDGLRVVAALMPAVEALAAEAQDLTLEDCGGAAFRSDLAALRHETQYTRLFRS